MNIKIAFTSTILLAAAVNAAEGASDKFYFRTPSAGVIVGTGADGPGHGNSEIDVDIADQGRAVLGSVGSRAVWNLVAQQGWQGPVVDKKTGQVVKTGVTFSSNYDLSQYGLALDPVTGQISGTPTQPFILADFVVTASADGSSDETKPFWIGVAPNGPLEVAVGQPDAFNFQKGSNFTTDAIVLDGAFGSVEFSKPSALSVAAWNAQKGIMSGVGSAVGTTEYQTIITDEFGRQASWSYRVNVYDGLTVAALNSVEIVGDIDYVAGSKIVLPKAFGLVGAPVWSVSGLPAGLQWDVQSGSITGTVTDATLQGVQTATLKVKDSATNLSASNVVRLNIATPMSYIPYAGATVDQWTKVDTGFNIRRRLSNEAYRGEGIVATITGGRLPSGLELRVSEEHVYLAGVVGEAGDFPLKIRIKDASGWTLQLPEILLRVNARDGLAFNVQDTSVVGERVYTAENPAFRQTSPTVINPEWSVEGLPEGLTMSPTTGTVTGAVVNSEFQGEREFVVTLKNKDGGISSSKSAKIAVYPPFTSWTYSGGTVTQWANVKQGFNLRDLGNGPYRNKGVTPVLVDGALPPGMEVVAVNEFIDFQGIPNQAGKFTSTWAAVDQNGWALVLQPVTFNVVARSPLTISAANATLIGEYVFTAQSPLMKLAVSNLIGTATWSATNLPKGLAINSATGAVTGSIIDGSEQGVHEVIFKVVDSADGVETTRVGIITVESPIFQVNYSGGTFSQYKSLTGGINIRGPGNYPWNDKGLQPTLVSGALPPGVTAAMGVGSNNNIIGFSGTPTAAGSFTSVWKAVDASGWSAQFTPVTFTVTNRAAVTVANIPSVQAAGNSNYSAAAPIVQAMAANIFGKVMWSAQGLPAGLLIDQNTGAITGSVADPSLVGTYSVTVKAVDDIDGSQGTTSFQLSIAAPFVAGNYSPALLKQKIAMTPAGFPIADRVTSLAYSRGPLAVTTVSGSLPPGISVDYVGGLVQFSGTPTTLGDYSVTLRLSDTAGWSVNLPTVTFKVDVRPQMVISPSGLLTLRGTIDYPFASPVRIMSATNLTGAPVWSATNLPKGMQIDPDTGRIWGQIAEADGSEQGVRTVTVNLLDGGDGATATLSFQVQVNPPWAVNNTVNTAIKRNVASSSAFNIRGPGNVAYRGRNLVATLVSGPLPPGYVLSVSNELIVFSGTPTATGTYPVTVSIRDMNGWSSTLETVTFKVTN